jgi:hypothetical protein
MLLNEQLHAHDMFFAKNSVLIYDLTLDVDFVWRINQLDPHIQDIAELCYVS